MSVAVAEPEGYEPEFSGDPGFFLASARAPSDHPEWLHLRPPPCGLIVLEGRLTCGREIAPFPIRTSGAHCPSTGVHVTQSSR
jgi:hypothetical protein